MNDSGHSGAVRLQATALIAAALVTTAGAVTSAFIQSGWIKPSSIAVAFSQTESKPLATFTGMIEPVDPSSSLNGSFALTNAVQTENRPAAFQDALPTARLKSAAPTPATYSQNYSAPSAAPAINSRSADAPRILPGNAITKPLMATSSWFSAFTPSILTQSSQPPAIQNQIPVQNQTAVQNQSTPPRPSGRPTNWTPMSR